MVISLACRCSYANPPYLITSWGRISYRHLPPIHPLGARTRHYYAWAEGASTVQGADRKLWVVGVLISGDSLLQTPSEQRWVALMVGLVAASFQHDNNPRADA